MTKLIYTLGVAPVVAAGHTLLGNAAFSSTINLGAILVGLLVIVIAGLFTVRSNVAKVWRENYEGEKERADNLEIEAKKQRELKHDALNELAAQKLKTDQTTVLTQLAQMQKDGQEMTKLAVESLLEATRKSEERLVVQMQALAETTGGVAKTTAGLVETVEKLNKRMDDVERRRNGG